MLAVVLDVVSVGCDPALGIGGLQNVAQRIVSKDDCITEGIRHAGDEAVGIGQGNAIAVEVLDVAEEMAVGGVGLGTLFWPSRHTTTPANQRRLRRLWRDSSDFATRQAFRTRSYPPAHSAGT